MNFDLHAKPMKLKPLQAFIHEWVLYRACGCGIKTSFLHAWRAFRR